MNIVVTQYFVCKPTSLLNPLLQEMKRLNNQYIAIFFFVLTLIIVDFIFWLVLSRQKECSPSQEHQEVMSWINKLLNYK